ncbi:hypothetical protein ACVWXO_009168 [Bradyrhizobium sp. LM2.7]
MLRTIVLAVLLLSSIGSKAFAQNCAQLPAGPARLDCAMKNPAFAAKRERCEEEGRKMGLNNQWSGSAGGLRPYMAACLKR